MISLQLRGRRQITEPRKYYLVRVIIFLWHVFSLFFFSHRLRVRLNFLQRLPTHKSKPEPQAKHVEWSQYNQDV